MKRTPLFAAAMLACTSAAALAQDKKPEGRPAPTAQPTPKPKPGDKPAAQPGQPTPEEMMKMMEELNKPNENHKILQQGVGTWSAKCKMWWFPGTPPEESTGSATVTSEMDGRFTKVDFKGSMGGKAFTGVGWYGYNTLTKKFESTWISSTDTGMMTTTGTYDASKKQLTWAGKMLDPMDNKEKPYRLVDTHIDDNTMTLEMYFPGPDGNEFKTMEINYTRTGGVKPAAAIRDPKPLPAEKVAPAKK